jgi:hypothetical protein
MIVDDFDILGAVISPSDTHPELVVDPDAVLSLSIAFKGFQTIPGWNAKVIQPARNLQLTKLAAGYRGNISKTLYRIAFAKSFSVGTPEGFYHRTIVTRWVINVKRFQDDCRPLEAIYPNIIQYCGFSIILTRSRLTVYSAFLCNLSPI